MSSIEWTPLPTLWPQPAMSAAFGEFELLVFTQDGVPTWEVRPGVRRSAHQSFDLITGGTADSFEAAKAAAAFEASVLAKSRKSK